MKKQVPAFLASPTTPTTPSSVDNTIELKNSLIQKDQEIASLRKQLQEQKVIAAEATKHKMLASQLSTQFNQLKLENLSQSKIIEEFKSKVSSDGSESSSLKSEVQSLQKKVEKLEQKKVKWEAEKLELKSDKAGLKADKIMLNEKIKELKDLVEFVNQSQGEEPHPVQNSVVNDMWNAPPVQSEMIEETIADFSYAGGLDDFTLASVNLTGQH